MAEAVNGAVLAWAREKQGLTPSDVAARLKCTAEQVQSWEQGKRAPTYRQLETLAYTIYKRPLAVFYFPNPPEEAALREDFRTLPAADLETLHGDTRYKVRLAHSFKLSLEELNDGKNPAHPRLFETAKLSIDMNVVQAAARVRGRLGISMERQIAWQDTAEAWKAWREAVEAGGVYVFKQSFKQKSISGFCLRDKEFPVILINNSTPPARQIFTLLHELAHILLGLSTVSKVADWDMARFDAHAKSIEVYCNAVAGEILVPFQAFDALTPRGTRVDDALIQGLSDRFKVSRETILRRLLDRSLVTQTLYEQKVAAWAKQAVQFKKKGGGDYYRTQTAYLGEAFLKLVFARHYQGRISLEQAAEHLGVKARNLSALEASLYPRGAGA